MDDKAKLNQLREIVTTQRADGNWNYDPYMHGMANGLELALATLEGREPQYLEAPPVWLGESRPLRQHVPLFKELPL